MSPVEVGETLSLSTFNALTGSLCATLLRECLAVDWWGQAVCAGRPYGDVTSLVEAAQFVGRRLGPDDVATALSRHPRIGERPRGGSASAQHSRTEQAGVSADLAERLADANRRYEQRFGRVFLIRAAGRTGEQILTELEARLANDDRTELDVIARELVEIAVLRLQRTVAA
jgi:2-oxo-4-hydroxy-4-carboxy-5-ureidoimidazoline decarboxylase